MKQSFSTLAFLFLFSGIAHGSGYVCENSRRDLVARVFQNTSEVGSGSAVMILSNPRLSEGNRLIARFGNVNGSVSPDAATYLAQPSIEPVPASYDRSESVGGFPLSEVSAFRLTIDFTWGRPRLHGEYVPGAALLETISGQKAMINLDCRFHTRD